MMYLGAKRYLDCATGITVPYTVAILQLQYIGLYNWAQVDHLVPVILQTRLDIYIYTEYCRRFNYKLGNVEGNVPSVVLPKTAIPGWHFQSRCMPSPSNYDMYKVRFTFHF